VSRPPCAFGHDERPHATALDVYKDRLRVGTLTRAEHGARFTYGADYWADVDEAPVAVAFAMPPRRDPYEVVGINLHPFLAGLLPEGLRLERRAGTQCVADCVRCQRLRSRCVRRSTGKNDA
jgi:HipA-like protein